jgi:hypothetical protein
MQLDKRPQIINSLNSLPKLRIVYATSVCLYTKSTVNLINDLQIPYITSIELVLFGITNMYTNILIKGFLDVIKLMYDRKNINVH